MPEVRGVVVLVCHIPGVIPTTDMDLTMVMVTMVLPMAMETTSTMAGTMLTMANVHQELQQAQIILMITREPEELPRMFLLNQAGISQEAG